MSAERQQLESAIAGLEAQRKLLGDDVVNTALVSLRAKLASLVEEPTEDLPAQTLRQVSILFLDIVGSTKLSQQLDPEQISEVMDGSLAEFTAIVAQYGGKVLKYAGDSVMAVFGAERTLEDDSERAVRAGLALLDRGRHQGELVKLRLNYEGFDVRVGVHTGDVLLGGGVDLATSIRGQAVNIAARMEQSAPAGGLRISQHTHRHVRGLFDVVPERQLFIKGVDEPVDTFLVQGQTKRPFRTRGVEGVKVPLIGRDADLRQLVEAFHATINGDTLSLLTVVGEAGVGKSRLLHEFWRWLELQPGPPQRLLGRPQLYGQNVPYGLLRDLLYRQFMIDDSDSQAVAKEKFARALAVVFVDRKTEQTALLGQLIGLDYSADPHIVGIANEARQIRDRAFHAGAQYLRLRYAKIAAPIVLMLDDLHWADDGSLDFIEHLWKSAADLPILILSLARPAFYDRRELWGSGHPGHRRIDLAPLSESSSFDLADALLQRIDFPSAKLRELITGAADGNPYFAEEMVGMLIDDGVIITGQGPWQVITEKLQEVKVPPTLATLLQARLDLLPPPERSALGQASVIGHVFWEDALLCIAAAAPAALDPLLRRELVRCSDTSVFSGTREFVFNHHMLHQVTYNSILKRHKRDYHRAAAEWLLRRTISPGTGHFARIAYHFEGAGDNEKAAAYHQKAGDEAQRSFANVAAIEHFSRALSLTPPDDLELRFDLLIARGTIFKRGWPDEEAADIVTLEELAEALDDDVKRSRAAQFRAHHSLLIGDYPAVASAAARAVELADSGAPDIALLARINWARALQFQGDYATAQLRLKEVLDLIRTVRSGRVNEVKMQHLELVALTQLAILFQQVGRYVEAREHIDQALNMARDAGDRVMEFALLNNSGSLHKLLGNYGLALELLTSARGVVQSIGYPLKEAYPLCNMADIALINGDPVSALSWADEALMLSMQGKDRDLEANLQSTRGRVLTATGRFEEASAAYSSALAIYREIGRPTMLSEPLAGLASIALSTGHINEARRHVEEIESHLDGGGIDGIEDAVGIYLVCHQVLSAAQSPHSARLLQRGHELLMSTAESLPESERDTFLTNVPSNAAMVQAWNSFRPAESP